MHDKTKKNWQRKIWQNKIYFDKVKFILEKIYVCTFILDTTIFVMWLLYILFLVCFILWTNNVQRLRYGKMIKLFFILQLIA